MTDRKEQLLNAACKIVVEEGAGALNMRRLGDAVGVSATAIYRHFKDRRALLQDVQSHAGLILASYLVESLKEPEATAQLEACGMAYLRFAVEHQPYFALLFGGPHALSRQPGVSAPGKMSASLQFLVERVAACVPNALPQPLLLELALEQWALVHGLASLYLYGGGSEALGLHAWMAMSGRLVARSAARVANHGAP